MTDARRCDASAFTTLGKPCWPATTRVPGASAPHVDREFSEEEYQAQLIEIRKDMPSFRRFLRNFKCHPHVEEFWENQARKNGNN